MKFSCQGADLNKALRTACTVSPRISTYAVLSQVRLDARGDKLAVTATNMDMQVTVTIDASVISEGSALVSASVARGLARSGHAAFELEDSTLVFRGAASSARLSTMPVSDFPVLAKDDGFKSITAKLSDILDCMPFASDEEARYYLRGVCVTPSHTVATDGHRLFSVEGGGGNNQIIPKDALALLSAMPGAKVALSENMWRATCDGVSAYGKLIDGDFPDWERTLPMIEATVTMQADDLAQAVAAISPVFDQRVRRLSFKGENGGVALSGEGGFGVAEAKAPAEGDLDAVNLNGKYLESVCAAFKGQAIDVASGHQVLTFTAGTRKAVVMGMR